jgi:hypothetical protein
MGFEFRCEACGEMHEGMPGFGAAAPLNYYAIPQAERGARCDLGSDDCVIDRRSFFGDLQHVPAKCASRAVTPVFAGYGSPTMTCGT